jgi:MSHA biogenesis protein MshP
MPAEFPNRQRGVGLLPALFVMIVGAVIGAALLQLVAGGSQASSLQITELRARTAAAAGLEWARYRIDRSNACAAGALNPAAGSLTGFVVTVSCVRTAHDDGGTPRAVYALSAFAQYAQYGSADYVTALASTTLVR